MDLGQRIKQARLEAGLSQRQLCADAITRNMLSQIENGSARPSMDTLRILAQRLEKPVSWFLEEESVSANQRIILQARALPARETLDLLKDYRAPDPVFDPERYLMEALACMDLAQTAIGEKRFGYAATLLAQAKDAGSRTPYCTKDLERRRLLLCYAAGEPAEALISLLPDSSDEFFLRSQAEKDPVRSGQLLDAAPSRTGQWHYLRAELYFSLGQYEKAAQHYRQAAQNQEVYSRLEQCYRELEDYKMAYFYACKQR